MSVNSKGSRKTVLINRLTRTFADCICDKYPFLKCWHTYCNKQTWCCNKCTVGFTFTCITLDGLPSAETFRWLVLS